MPKPQNIPDAVRDMFRSWGSQGGKTGGKARWEGVSPEERRKQARQAALARWRRKSRRSKP
jgi:hypothetical protein